MLNKLQIMVVSEFVCYITATLNGVNFVFRLFAKPFINFSFYCYYANQAGTFPPDSFMQIYQ